MANSESTGTNSIPGIEGAGQANGVKSDAMSNISSNSAATNYGPGSSDAGSSVSPVSREIDEKRKESKSFWGRFGKKKSEKPGSVNVGVVHVCDVPSTAQSQIP